MGSIEKLITEHNVLYAVVASPDGTRWEEYGDKTLLPYQGIDMYYFPRPEKMSEINEFLKGQLMPKTIKQGELMCVICKPLENIIVGIFVIEKGNILENMKQSKAINESVKAIFQ